MNTTTLVPHGFCAGVRNAIKTALGIPFRGGTVYCLHELVHNELVVEDLRKRGFLFVESLDEVPDGSQILFSAHGVSPQIRAAARRKGLDVIDATCPFVKRVHLDARRFSGKGLKVVVIGKKDHVETIGILGEAPDAVVVGDPAEAAALAYDPSCAGRTLGIVSQTTMNSDSVKRIVEILSERFPVETAAETCNATKERQDAVKAFRGDALLVLGSANSSNTKRLCEIFGAKTFRAADMDEVRSLDFSGVAHLGVTSGASTPEEFLSEAVAYLETLKN